MEIYRFHLGLGLGLHGKAAAAPFRRSARRHRSDLLLLRDRVNVDRGTGDTCMYVY